MAIATVIDEQLDIVPWMQLQSASSGPEPATLSAMAIMVAIIIVVIVLIFMVAARGLGLGGDKVVGGAQHGACDASAPGQHEGVFGFAADTSGEAMLIDEVGREFGPDIGCHGWKSDTGEDAETAQGNGESGRFRHCRFSFRGLEMRGLVLGPCERGGLPVRRSNSRPKAIAGWVFLHPPTSAIDGWRWTMAT
jgi:hypothetical protein